MNGYHDEPACEHRYPDGQVCGEAAVFVLYGLLLCEPHFEDVVTTASTEAYGEQRAADIRFAAKPMPEPPGIPLAFPESPPLEFVDD
ncbi:MAG TPA: hypothetical protein VK573_02805 [Gemmatimonadales bacterium]|nr:hypothetical protein [Gemmatimonadales bacterium]